MRNVSLAVPGLVVLPVIKLVSAGYKMTRGSRLESVVDRVICRLGRVTCGQLPVSSLVANFVLLALWAATLPLG